jgi:4-amino-4-deoxy-L-arabinose transferase-like glycosyltransferase
VTARHRAAVLLGILALGLALYLPGLGREILRHPLEAKYAMAAREMLRGGPLLVAHLFGQLYPDKPPLYFWATAGVARLRGGRLDEVTARLPAVAAALASVVATVLLGEALFGAPAGVGAGAILASSGLFFWYARQGHPDQLLTAGVAVACLGLWRSWTEPPGWRRRGWIALAYGAMGLAVLSKGLLGLVLPLLAGGAYLALVGPLRAVPARLGLAPGLPVFLAVVLAWYGPALSQYGTGYLYETVIHQHLERYARSWVHRAGWYYYLPEFTAGFLPWSLFVPGALGLAWRAWRGAAAAAAGGPERGPETAAAPFAFPLAWFITGFVFFSAATGKRGAYLLPLYPAAALLVAWLWTQPLGSGRPPRRLGAPVALLAGAAGTLALGVLVLPRRLIPGRMVDTLVPADPSGKALAAAALLVGAAAVWMTWRRGRPTATLGLIVLVQALCLHAVAAVRAPQYEARYPVRALAERIRALAPADPPLLSLVGDYDFLIAFYLDRSLVPLSGASELLAARAGIARHALVDEGERDLLRQPGVHLLTEGRLGPKRIMLVRLDPLPG